MSDSDAIKTEANGDNSNGSNNSNNNNNNNNNSNSNSNSNNTATVTTSTTTITTKVENSHENSEEKALDHANTSPSISYGAVRGTTQTTSDVRFDPLKAANSQTTTAALQQMQSAATKQALANAKQQTLLAQKLKQMNNYAWPTGVPTEQQPYGLLPSMGWPADADYSAYGLNNLLFPTGVANTQAFTNSQNMAVNPALAMSLNPLINPLVNPLMNPFASALQGAFTAGVPDGKQHALFVFHLPEDIDDHGLLQLFAPYGAIRANVMRQEDGRTRGFGFVHFNNRHDASIAIEMMNGHQIGRKRLMVSFKKEKNEPSNMGVHDTQSKSSTQL